MADVPSKGDRLTAKVRLIFYVDENCTRDFPPVPPGIGYKTTFQIMDREAGSEVGVFTGKMSEIGYEVDWIQQYRHVPEWPKAPQNIIIPRTSWVKKNEVTGFWDTGVDAPQVETVYTDPPPVDNTNTFLGLAIVGAGIFKFSRRNRKK
ncbi:hypothetical protein [Dyadobacter bucti]|uniref:hypothetical protein n=1 Tax=Dyadobacter bucti TaxID=2572203 RepID=UPI003F6FC518